MSKSNVTIHDSVRERYANFARAVPESTASCCGSEAEASCGCESNLYDDALLEGLHSDVVNLSLGCGDPVSIASLKQGETVLDLGSGGGIDCFLAAKQVGETGYVIGVDMTPKCSKKPMPTKPKWASLMSNFAKARLKHSP